MPYLAKAHSIAATHRKGAITISVIVLVCIAPSLNRQRRLYHVLSRHFFAAFRFFLTAFCIPFCFALPALLLHFGQSVFLSLSASTSQNDRQDAQRRFTIMLSPQTNPTARNIHRFPIAPPSPAQRPEKFSPCFAAVLFRLS